MLTAILVQNQFAKSAQSQEVVAAFSKILPIFEFQIFGHEIEIVGDTVWYYFCKGDVDNCF